MSLKFLGCTVKSFSSLEGWGQNSATLTVTVVQDNFEGDEFLYESNASNGIHEIATLSVGAFTFNGLISSWRKLREESGNPVYEINLVDPREILAGSKLITSSYYGLTNIVPNVINVFGYWENVLGFGNSQSNEGGMPWQLILMGMNRLINQNISPLYGGPLRYKNNTFTVDLSQVPVAPFYYRIQGTPDVSILQCIEQVCDDAGFDWFCELQTNNVIKIRTINRRNQLAINRRSITPYANSIQEAKNINSGWEAINDQITSKLLFGANVSELYMADTSAIYPYWGTDYQGNHLYSPDLQDNTPLTINAISCLDILNSYYYNAKVAELRIALMGEQAWLTYISVQRQDIATILNLPTLVSRDFISWMNSNSGKPAGPSTLTAELTDSLARFFTQIATAESATYNRVKRIYEMVKQAAENYMGKSFVVNLPFILSGYDIETNELYFNYDVDQEGGYVSFGDNLLGLTEQNRLLFEQSPGRVGAFGKYDTYLVDPKTVINPNCVVQQEGVFVKGSVDTEVKLLPFPCVIVHLSQPVYEARTTVYGGSIANYINILFNSTNETEFRKYLNNNIGSFAVGVGISPVPKVPENLAIPLRSRVEVYGGSIAGRGYWFLRGVNGATEVEKDDSLNPWTYGGYGGMNLAAYAKLFAVAVNSYAVETGSVTFPSLPQHSLGDELYYQGSNINAIELNVSDGGYVTTYRLKSFDPRVLGGLAKREEARLARIGKVLAKQRQLARIEYERIFGNAITAYNIVLQNVGTNPAFNPNSPHTLLFAKNWSFDNNQGYHEMGSMTAAEAMVNLDPRDSNSFKNSAMMSVNGLFRPFSTDVNNTTTIPAFTLPNTNVDQRDTLATAYSFNPFRSKNDIFIYSKGDNFTQDVKALKYNYNTAQLDYSQQGDPTLVRGIGLRGPPIMVGFGFNFKCKSVVTDDAFLQEDDRKRIDRWKAGPMDAIWDEVRGVWTFHGNVYGKMTADLTARTISQTGCPSSSIRLLGKDDIDLDYTIDVYNLFNAQISSGTRVVATYFANQNRFCITAADC